VTQIKQLKVGIIGAGMMGMHHAEAVKRCAKVTIVAISDPNRKTAEKAADALGIDSVYTDYKEMLCTGSLDAVHVCTPNHTHIEICEAAIRAGISVFCEKPLGNSSKETGALVELAQKSGLVGGVNFNYRQNVVVREMHERITSPSWGRTFMIRGSYIQDWMMYDSDYNWRCVTEINGPSRTMADIGSHWFDAVQYITGQQVKRVYALPFIVHPQRKKFAHQARTFESQSGSDYELVDIDTEDAAFVLFEMTDGTPGILTLSQVSAGYKNSMSISIDGSASSITWEQENPDKLIVRTRENGSTLIHAAAGGMHGDANLFTTLPGGHPVGWADALKNSVSSFYAAIRGERRDVATFEDADYIVRIVEACLRSGRTGEWESVSKKLFSTPQLIVFAPEPACKEMQREQVMKALECSAEDAFGILPSIVLRDIEASQIDSEIHNTVMLLMHLPEGFHEDQKSLFFRLAHEAIAKNCGAAFQSRVVIEEYAEENCARNGNLLCTRD